jgi:hypothetical protein
MEVSSRRRGDAAAPAKPWGGRAGSRRRGVKGEDPGGSGPARSGGCGRWQPEQQAAAAHRERGDTDAERNQRKRDESAHACAGNGIQNQNRAKGKRA